MGHFATVSLLITCTPFKLGLFVSRLGHSSSPHNILFPFLPFETVYSSRLRLSASSFMWFPLITPAGCDLSGISRGWQNLSEKVQIINILASQATTVPVASTKLCHCSVKAAIDYINEWI